MGMIGNAYIRNLHVNSTDLQAIRHVYKNFIRAECKNDKNLKELRKEAYRTVLKSHHEHQKFVENMRL